MNKKILIYTIAIYLGAMMMCMGLNLAGAALPGIIGYYDMPLDSGGLMTTLQYIGGTVVVLLLSKLLDKSKKSILLIVGIALAMVLLFMIGRVPSYMVFMILYFVLGASLSLIDVSNNAILGDIQKENRIMVLSLMHGICGVGAAIIPIITVLTGSSSDNDFGNVYSFVGILFLILLIINILAYIFGRKTIDACKPTEVIATAHNDVPFFKNKYVWFALISQVGFGACQAGITAWAVKYAREMFPLQGDFAFAFALSAYWIGTALCRVLTGIIPALNRMKSRTLIVYGGILGGVALAFGVFCGNYYGFIVGVLIMGLMNGASLPRTIGLLTNWYPDKSGLTSSVSYIAMYLGYIIVPLTMGVIGANLGLVAMMVVPIVGTVISGVACITMPKE